MPIVAVCGNCSKRYTLDDKFAGKSVKCRTCKESFEVPGDDDTTLMADASPPGASGGGKVRRTTTSKSKKRKGRGGGGPDDDVLELRTEFAKRAAAPTIEEPRGESAESSSKSFDRATGRSSKSDRGTRKRYKKKKRWLLKGFVALIVLLGLAIGVGVIFVPKNMAKKWDQTKAFWGTGLKQWALDMVTIDTALESAEEAPTPEEEAAAEPEGPPAGSTVIVRGVIVAVERGSAGRNPSTFKVKGSNGVVYRIVLDDPSDALADIKGNLQPDGEDGPSVEVRGTLAKNPFDSKMTQVEQPSWAQKEPADIEGQEPFVVESEPKGEEDSAEEGDEEGDDESGAGEGGDDSGDDG
ncbi:MAG: hypothetical protein ACYTGX_02520 [Planctomycetota bacterium]|jgi:hypothetical protein